MGALVTGGSVLAAPSTDADVNDYAQCANDKPGSVTPTVDPTDCVPQGWINGILNANNSQYREDQVTPQRVGLDLPDNGRTTGRTITVTYLARKGQGGAGNHAYDSLATWNYTETTANRCQGLLAADCPGGSASTFQIPSDPTVVADSNGAGSSTALHELPAANRLMTMYGGTITGVSAPVHDNAEGSGDDYATVTVTYSVASTPTKVQLLFGGHLAPSVGPRGWGNNVGASFINGGPYHIRLDSVDNSSLGNRDNQIMSGAILPIGTQTKTALHETTSAGVDVNPANNQDPTTQTGITVTLPVNGSGTYVTDYATVAPAGSTGTVAFRFYSSQAACTADTAFTGGTSAGSGKTLDANSVAKSDPVHITSAGVTYWRAVFSGTGISASSDSGCNDEILTANQATSTATTLHETTSLGADVNPANNGDPISINAGGYVTDYASVTPASATGSAAFKWYATSSDCASDTNGTAAGGGTLSSGSAHSNTVQFGTSGTFYWKAFFTGTNNNNNSQSSCEVLNVRQPTTTTTTLHETTSLGADVNPANNGDPISVVVGGYVTDYASVTPNGATGSVAFKRYASLSNCTNDTNGTAAGGGTINSGSAHSNTVQFNSAGTFYWKAFFTGTGLNNNSQSSCEVLHVTAKQPGLETTPSEAAGAIGDKLSDTATLSGATDTAGGTIDFYLFKPGDDCSDLKSAVYSSLGVAVSGNGDYKSSDGTESGSNTTDQAGIYHWLAKYSGDDNNDPAASTCASEPVDISPNKPGLETTPSEAAGAIGDKLSDTATLSGATDTAGGTIDFYLFKPGDDCSDLKSAVYSSLGVAVSGNGDYKSSDGTESGSNTTDQAGIYHWLAKYSGDDNNDPAASTCASEPVDISPNKPAVDTDAGGPYRLSPNGVDLTDKATLSGATSGAKGMITFSLFKDDGEGGCGDQVGQDVTVEVDGNGLYTSPAIHVDAAGTYHWIANYSGDSNNSKTENGCNEENENALVISPSISISKDPASQTVRNPGTASWTITVKNTGDAALTDVHVDDAVAPGCARSAADIAADPNAPHPGTATFEPGDTYSYDCSKPGVTADFTNTATATGTPPVGDNVTAQDSADVHVINPHISVVKSPDSQTIVSGQTATFTIQVINDGDVTLTNVVVTDALAPGCARTKADIPGLASMPPVPAAGSTITYSCTLANVTSSFTNVATATGTPPIGSDVSSQDTAGVTVVQPVTHPAISIVKDPNSQTVENGGTATFTITVLNTGDVTLTDVTVTDARSPNCDRTIGTLAPGQSVSYKCTKPNVTASFDNVAIATGHAGSTTVTAQDTAHVNAKAPFVPPKPKVVSHKKPKTTG